MTFVSRHAGRGLTAAFLFALTGAAALAEEQVDPQHLVLSDRVQKELKGDERPKVAAVAGKSGSVVSSPARSGSYNDLVLAAVESMPAKGTYSISPKANQALSEAIKLEPTGKLVLKPSQAMPCYCSGATYLVFLSVLERLQREGKLPLNLPVGQALLMQRQPDGVGIWGRWNANGPGTAVLFHELHLGKNFTSFDEARPGDFLKLWWNDEIGARERGHSVVYLESGKDATGEATVTFWSANIPEGYSRKTVLKSKIHRALFSRLEDPAAVKNAPELAGKDAYLAEMLKRGSTEQEMAAKVGITK